MTDKSNCLMAQNDTELHEVRRPAHHQPFRQEGARPRHPQAHPYRVLALADHPEWYKWECSDSQAYRMLGNGWTVEVIKHIFNFLPFARERATESQRR